MKLNTKTSTPTLRTHEGAPAKRTSAYDQLRRSVMTCLLWESGFYEDGKEIANRIEELVAKNKPTDVVHLAFEARNNFRLRHVPLLIAAAMAKLDSHKGLVAVVLTNVIQRPDELAEFLAIYWRGKKTPLSNQVKKGLAQAFVKFNTFQLSKWNKDGDIKLRDVMFLVHPKPKDKEQTKAFKQLAENTLPVADTWEVALSNDDGVSKKTKWTALIKEDKLAAMAYLMNLRNMTQAGVSEDIIREGLEKVNVEKMFPYRFISAARHNPHLEDILESKMMECLKEFDKLEGKTLLLIDVSGSMDSMMSGKSEMTYIDAACGLAILAKELGESVEVYTFSDRVVRVAPRSGFALRDAINKSQVHSGTRLGSAVTEMYGKTYDRLIVITDEQSHDRVPNPTSDKKHYMINVAATRNGVGYGKWIHVDGWSDKVFSYIQEIEKE